MVGPIQTVVLVRLVGKVRREKDTLDKDTLAVGITSGKALYRSSRSSEGSFSRRRMGSTRVDQIRLGSVDQAAQVFRVTVCMNLQLGGITVESDAVACGISIWP